MIKRTKWIYVAFTTAAVITMASGCSPSVQSPAQPNLGAGTVSHFGIGELQQAVQLGEQSGKYKIKSDVQLLQGTIHTDFSVYGSVNLPDRVSVSFHENNFNVSFFQQGQSAYALGNSQWVQTNPISDLNVFPSYERLFQYILKSGIPVYQLDSTFDVDENCHVYQATVPGVAAATLSLWANGFGPEDLSPVKYTFFIGEKTHLLLEIQTQSVGAITGMGSIGVNSDTVLFSQGKPEAIIQIPNDLVKQLKNQPS